MACSARRFDLLRNAPRSSIHIHFGVALLVLTASLTSASLSKISFLTDCNPHHHPVMGIFLLPGSTSTNPM